jgi:hypothetical protein
MVYVTVQWCPKQLIRKIKFGQIQNRMCHVNGPYRGVRDPSPFFSTSSSSWLSPFLLSWSQFAPPLLFLLRLETPSLTSGAPPLRPHPPTARGYDGAPTTSRHVLTSSILWSSTIASAAQTLTSTYGAAVTNGANPPHRPRLYHRWRAAPPPPLAKSESQDFGLTVSKEEN